MFAEARTDRWSAAVIATVAAAAVAALNAAEAAAQERTTGAERTLRAVEVVHPASGAGSRSLLRPLIPEERLGIESALDEAGFRPGAVDGVFDGATARALGAFQRQQELDVCGCVDLPTAEALGLEVRVVVTEIASGAEQVGARGRQGPEGREASTAGVEVVYPTRPAPVSGPVGEPAPAADERGAAGGVEGPAAGTPTGEVPVTYHRGGMFVGSTLGVPFLVVDSAGNLVPFRPGLPVVSPGELGTRPPRRWDPSSRHRIPLPPIRGGGRPPSGGGGSGGGGSGGGGSGG